jgi:hypothetical protein
MTNSTNNNSIQFNQTTPQNERRAALFKHHASSYSDGNPSPLGNSDPTKDMIETHTRAC